MNTTEGAQSTVTSILIVEDSSTQAMLLQNVLGKGGYAVPSPGTANKAVNSPANIPPVIQSVPGQAVTPDHRTPLSPPITYPNQESNATATPYVPTEEDKPNARRSNEIREQEERERRQMEKNLANAANAAARAANRAARERLDVDVPANRPWANAPANRSRVRYKSAVCSDGSVDTRAWEDAWQICNGRGYPVRWIN